MILGPIRPGGAAIVPARTARLTGLATAVFHYNTPNRYGIPAFYALHVWAWKSNPHGVFVDWNPRVSCE